MLETRTVTAGEALVQMLRRHDVEIVFGLCGDTSLPWYDALRSSAALRHVLTRDERHAAYMADAYSRISGRVGVCEGPSGGGATYILPGVVEANESSIPVLAITTDIGVASRGHFVLTELDQRALFAPLTKWNASIDAAAELPRLVREAFLEMTTGRPGAAHLALPFDVQREEVRMPPPSGESAFGSYPSRRVEPDGATLTAAAKLLAQAERPIAICGGGVVISGAQAELAALAERLGFPVATTISGKGSIAETHPLAAGVVGSNGGVPETRRLVDEADLVVFIGCRAGSVTTERWRHPARGSSKVVHIDVDPRAIGANYPTDAAIVGDAKLALGALCSELEGVRVRTNRDEAVARVARAKEEKFARFRSLAEDDRAPIRPEKLVQELERALASR
ncbi:MAG TPA: thiamine pyrophosphate-binding protein, partial [Verrucomicrobiae bacterium]|nr:thiamine pyrophosphate-binding protein [Verrucomicrobiae bacterium]